MSGIYALLFISNIYFAMYKYPVVDWLSIACAALMAFCFVMEE